MPFDRDGTIGAYSYNGAITQLTGTQLAQLNDESDNSGQPSLLCDWVALIFPESRDIDGFFIALARATGGSIVDKVEVSANTTSGADGSWTQIQAQYTIPGGAAVNPNYRTDYKAATALGQRAVRITPGARGALGTGNWAWAAVHVYGSISPGQNPNRLSIWNASADARASANTFDWGDSPRGSSADKQFRVKNLSSTLSANSVRISTEVLTEASVAGAPTVASQHTLSTDGTTFAATVNVGNLAPGAISGVLTIRRNTPSNAQLGPWALRVVAEALSGWS